MQLIRRFDNWDQTRRCFSQSVTAMIRRASRFLTSFRPLLVGPKDRNGSWPRRGSIGPWAISWPDG